MYHPPPASPPALPPFTPHIFKLALIAVGDADSAALLTAAALAPHLGNAAVDEEQVLRTLVEQLPTGWLSWPSETGPGEWLRLGVRHEQSDRLLSLLGEWTPQERIGLALYLLWDVRRDELDGWLGTPGLGERIGLIIDHMAQSLRLIPAAGTSQACRDNAADLVDADDPQLGRLVRRHTLGCEVCARRVGGLRATAELVRRAFDVFFRVTPPGHLAQLAVEQRHALRRRPIRRWQPALLALTLVTLWAVWLREPPVDAAPPAPPARPTSAAQLLDRALDRFGQSAPGTGVLHERVSFVHRDTRLLLERWYDYGPKHRLRVTVRHPHSAAPILDLGSDGTDRIAYDLNRASRRQEQALVRTDAAATLTPLLRQLPYAGSLGDSRIDQRYLDLTLLAQARRAGATLLGTTSWQGRLAALLSSTSPDGRLLLTIDLATGSLLEARIADAGGGTARTRSVWRAEVVEVLPRVRADTFDLPPRETAIQQINPRQLLLRPMSNLDLNTTMALGLLPIPDQLPEPPLLSYIRSINRGRPTIVQIYESQWSTVALAIPRGSDPGSLAPLDRAFARGRYTIQPTAAPDTTIAEFSVAELGERRMRLYLWHGRAADTEREALVATILDSLVLVSADNVQTYRDRFVPPTATARPDALTPPRLGNTTGDTRLRRRYLLAKNDQLLLLDGADRDSPTFLDR